MKKLFLLYLLPLLGFAQVSTSPSTIEIDQQITITVDINSSASNCNGLDNPNKVYMHSGVGDDSNPWGISVVGNWGDDDGVGEMTNNGDGTWSISFIPQNYYGLSTAEASLVTKMGLVFRSDDGLQELKDNGCTDFFLNVGAFQVTLINPGSDGVVLVNSGNQTQIIASNTNGPANYELFVDGTSYHTATNTTFYQSSFVTNITENKACQLVISQGSSSVTKPFNIFVNNTTNQAIPSGLEQGVNYNDSNPSIATLVLEAPQKDFIYVAGSFNNWTPMAQHAMKKNPDSDLFWIELTGLTSGEIETFQYWVFDQSPISGSPKQVKTADPYSTLVLSPFDDPYIPAETYPNLPPYPQGQEREVTVLQTGQTQYNWQVTNFNKPAKEDLVIYELLIRDFDADRNFQDIIDKIDYFKNLNINAIELMPIMEFEGNESWGYNTSFHMALDKFYGTQNKFKELVDVCHQNGIAVILDLAINHAFGRNPLVRMWMDDLDENGWGEPSAENPYFNPEATHSYSVGSDFNHSRTLTKNYTKRVIKHWIEEYNIDGFRWDLTKGFTQNCTSGDEGCTNSYQADRVAVLKEYADYSWSLDPDHYVIFEHLGGQQEQKEWADYRINEDKGIMLWGKITTPYNQLTMGYASDSNFEGVGHNSQNFIGKRLIGYAESHDEERLMYRNLLYGSSSGAYDITELSTALQRMPALGAVTLTIPGPKMIWHFGELGMENSIYTCNDGSVNDSSGNNGDCKLDTKPQPQWVNNWQTDPLRSEIYNSWSRLNALKINEAVFEGSYSINSGTLTPRIFIWDDDLPASSLKNVVILANFNLTQQNITPDFPYTGTWYDLMDPTGNSTINVTSTTTPISIHAGEFRIFGNAASEALSAETPSQSLVMMLPNPAKETIQFNRNLKDIEIFDISGKSVLKQQEDYQRGQHIDIRPFNPGLYLVKVQTNTGQTTHLKLIKN